MFFNLMMWDHLRWNVSTVSVFYWVQVLFFVLGFGMVLVCLGLEGVKLCESTSRSNHGFPKNMKGTGVLQFLVRAYLYVPGALNSMRRS